MRYVAFTITLFLAMPARAQETTVWFTILARGGTEDVEIGPDGGLVPYRLWMETDPLGTPGNFGIWSLNVTIETNLGVIQARLKRELPARFAVGGELGDTKDDDLTTIFATQRSSGRGGGSCGAISVGQSGPQAVGSGQLIVAPAPIGTEFHARVKTEPPFGAEQPLTSTARVLIALAQGLNCGIDPERPDRVVGNTLSMRVVADPRSPADFDRDGDVDLADYLRFLQTFACPEGPTAFGCDAGDLDWDGDVDLADLIRFQSKFTGSR